MALWEDARPLTDEVEVLVDLRNRLSGVVYVTVNARSQGGESREQIKGILERVRPVLAFLDAALVRGLELALVVERSDTHAELGHGVQGGREPAQE